MDFKERLKSLRKERGITQSQLAEILNYGYTAISNYESGRNEPSIKDIKKISEFFDVSVDYLLCVSEIRKPYILTEENQPDELFLNKYATLSRSGKKQLASLMDWLINQHPDMMLDLDAAQGNAEYAESDK